MGSNSVLKRRGIALISAAIIAGGASAMPVAYAQDGAATGDGAVVAQNQPELPLTEMQSGNLPVGPQDYFWRLPIGTSKDLEDVKISVQLPKGYDATVKRPEAIADLTATLS